MKTAEIRSLSLLCALVAGGCAATPGLSRTTLDATLTGQQQTPGPADLDGTGTARIRLDGGSGRLCWDLNVRGIGRATSAAIHAGPAGSVGPAVVALTSPDAGGRSEGCAAISPEVASRMAVQAHQFYLTVADEAHPQGAIRGQLRGGIIPPERRPPPARR
jgi:hypothetical protein